MEQLTVNHWSKAPVKAHPEFAFPIGGNCLCGAIGACESGEITCKDCIEMLTKLNHWIASKYL